MSQLLVHLDLNGVTHSVGSATITLTRATLGGRFEYDRGYLALRGAYAIDPALPLNAASQLLPRGLPGAFLDASPDLWGRNLISRRARLAAAENGDRVPALDERDYLLGVADETRQGALRFATRPGGAFQHPGAAVPQLLQLSTLLEAAEEVARDGSDASRAIATLLNAGTGSLGGARPKASVRDGDRLLIAKFPHPHDEWNVMRWEKTALDLAGRAGIRVPRNRLVAVGDDSVLLLDRFDREGSHRIGYASAMTILRDQNSSDRDYVEIAEAVPERSIETSADLRELWRRIAFSIAINNTDDHLRNHGFLRKGNGWALSPAFDLNPNPVGGSQRATSINGELEPFRQMTALMNASDVFGLDPASAKQIAHEVAEATAQWREVAAANGVSGTEIDWFAPTLDEAVTWVTTAAR